MDIGKIVRRTRPGQLPRPTPIKMPEKTTPEVAPLPGWPAKRKVTVPSRPATSSKKDG